MTNEQLYRALEKIIRDSSNSGTPVWLGPIISAIIGFAGVLLGVYAVKKNLNTQIESELSKVRDQYEYDQKRDNRNFLNKLLFGKLSELYSKVQSWFADSNYLIVEPFAIEVLKFAQDKSRGPEKAAEEYGRILNHHDNNLNEALKLIAFFPEFEEDFNILFTEFARIKIVDAGEVLNKCANGELTNEDALEFRRKLSHITLEKSILLKRITGKISDMVKELDS